MKFTQLPLAALLCLCLSLVSPVYTHPVPTQNPRDLLNVAHTSKAGENFGLSAHAELKRQETTTQTADGSRTVTTSHVSGTTSHTSSTTSRSSRTTSHSTSSAESTSGSGSESGSESASASATTSRRASSASASPSETHSTDSESHSPTASPTGSPSPSASAQAAEDATKRPKWFLPVVISFSVAGGLMVFAIIAGLLQSILLQMKVRKEQKKMQAEGLTKDDPRFNLLPRSRDGHQRLPSDTSIDSPQTSMRSLPAAAAASQVNITSSATSFDRKGKGKAVSPPPPTLPADALQEASGSTARPVLEPLQTLMAGNERSKGAYQQVGKDDS